MDGNSHRFSPGANAITSSARYSLRRIGNNSNACAFADARSPISRQAATTLTVSAFVHSPSCPESEALFKGSHVSGSCAWRKKAERNRS